MLQEGTFVRKLMNGLEAKPGLLVLVMLDARLVAFGYPASTFVQELSKTKYMNRK